MLHVKEKHKQVPLCPIERWRDMKESTMASLVPSLLLVSRVN